MFYIYTICLISTKYNPNALTNQQISELNTYFYAAKYFLRR